MQTLARLVIRWQLSAVLALVLVLVGLGTSAASAQGKSTSIEMDDNYFEPARQTVYVGDTITWKNIGQRPHTVTARNGEFDSGTLRTGQSFSYTVKKAGDIAYYCQFHGADGMTATLSVTAAGQDNSSNNKGAPHELPKTGAGGAASRTPWAALGLAVLTLAALGVLRARRA